MAGRTYVIGLFLNIQEPVSKTDGFLSFYKLSKRNESKVRHHPVPELYEGEIVVINYLSHSIESNCDKSMSEL